MKIISTSSQNLAFRTLHLYFYTLILFRYSPRYVFPRVSRCPVKLGKGGEKGFMIRACLGEKMSQLLSTKTWLPSYIWLLCRLITFFSLCLTSCLQLKVCRCAPKLWSAESNSLAHWQVKLWKPSWKWINEIQEARGQFSVIVLTSSCSQ